MVMAQSVIVPDFAVRLMTAEDAKQALSIWAETGMYQAAGSLETWLKVDPGGMFVAATPQGHVLGTCCAVFSKGDLAFLGLYAVRDIYRGKGVGGRILRAALERLGERNCALNTADVHLKTYRDRAGFRLQSGWFSICCVKKGDQVLEACSVLRRDPSLRVLAISPELLREVVRYDEAVHGFNRALIVTSTVGERDCFSLVAVGVDDQVEGYGVIRKDTLGYGIVGPLYADNPLTAETIASELIRGFDPARRVGVVFMGLKNNPGSLAIAEKMKMEVDDVCERLFTKEIVSIPCLDKVFAQQDLNFSSF